MIYLILLGVMLTGQCYAKKHNYDNFDVEKLLSNGTRSKAFFECVGDETKCTDQDLIDIKHDVVEMVSTSCAECTKKEKQKFGEALTALRRSMKDSQVLTMVVNKITNMFQEGAVSDSEKSSR